MEWTGDSVKSAALASRSQAGLLGGFMLTQHVASLAPFSRDTLVGYLTPSISSDLDISPSKFCVIKLLRLVFPEWTGEPYKVGALLK